MSDPLKHTDIDDLVSSIRRLVSDENRGEAAEQTPTAEETVAEVAEPESFVLSPTLRVSDAEDPYQAIHRLEEKVANVVEPPKDSEAVAPAEVEEPEPEQKPSAEVLKFHDPEVDEMSEAEDLEASAIFRSINRRGTSRLVEEARELAEQEHGETPVDAPDVLETEAKPSPDSEDVAERVEPAEQTPPSDALEAEIVDLDELIPEEVETVETSPEPQDQRMTGELVDVAEAPEPMVEGVLDEEQLREIVADVVREELAGHLGERITRNVRKLVRRELRQLMANTEYE